VLLQPLNDCIKSVFAALIEINGYMGAFANTTESSNNKRREKKKE
jgi:hypothetical protein